ncbi:MAG: hypothetical protein ABIP75_10410 [Pyrinomonadaceae bacterium]
MKTRILTIAIIVLGLAGAALAQSVTITPRKVTYRRTKPIMKYKKTFVITYPRVKAPTPALSRKIEATIDPVTVLGLNLKDEMNDIQWLEEAGYEVNYNKNGILSMTLSANGTAAYPDGFERYVAVELKTGVRIQPGDAFTDLPGLAAMVRKTQKAEIAAALVEIKKEDPETEDPASLFKDSDFTTKELKEFTIGDNGVTFIYDYGFPHVIQALQPEGHYFMTWQQLKPFLKTNGPLGRFVR